jgi:hypothetical protein
MYELTITCTQITTSKFFEQNVLKKSVLGLCKQWNGELSYNRGHINLHKKVN